MDDLSISKILATALPVHTEYCIMTIFVLLRCCLSQCTLSTVLWQCRVFYVVYIESSLQCKFTVSMMLR